MLISIFSLCAHASSGTPEPKEAVLQYKHDYDCGNN